MNRVSVSWTLLAVVVLALFVYRLQYGRRRRVRLLGSLLRADTFVNVPQQVNPEAPITTDSAVTEANDQYAALLLFIKNNPSKAAGFLTDIQRKFFDRSCTLRSDINFNDILNFPEGAPFR
jgi:hypothetical protein